MPLDPNPTGKRRDYASLYVQDANGCWLFAGSVNNRGYGTIRGRAAHRWFYEHFIAPIPVGLQIDHLCRVRLCVNPGHLEPVTPSQNVTRSVLARLDTSACKNGHARTPQNWNDETHRCRVCGREQKALWRRETGRH